MHINIDRNEQKDRPHLNQDLEPNISHGFWLLFFFKEEAEKQRRNLRSFRLGNRSAKSRSVDEFPILYAGTQLSLGLADWLDTLDWDYISPFSELRFEVCTLSPSLSSFLLSPLKTLNK